MTVGKLKEYVEKQGFTFEERDDLHHSDADCYVRWNSFNAYSVGLRKSISGTIKLMKMFKRLTRISVSNTIEDLNWLCELGDVTALSLWNFDNKKDMHKLDGLEFWASANTIQYVSLHNLLAAPSFIMQFKELRKIKVSNSIIAFTIPDWLPQMHNLEELDLTFSNIQCIPYSLVETGLSFVTNTNNIPVSGRFIDLRGVTLKEGEISLFSQPRDVIKAYYQGKVYGTQEAERECKVIFLGEGNAGKSSLIDRIEYPDRSFVPGQPATPGVRVTKWNAQTSDGSAVLRIMDFGGQEIMHSMHRCFLTEHTVYVIVCESRADGNVDAEAVKWVETVNTFAPGCPVILALNKVDINPHVSVNVKDLQQRNPALKQVLKTSAVVLTDSEYGAKRLAEAILKEVPGCIDRFLANADWLGVKRELEEMVENNQDYFTADEYREICRRQNIGDGEDALRFKMLDHFKNLGVSYYYDPHGLDHGLESIRVLNPAWLTNGIYRLILRTPEGGFLKRSNIRKLLETEHTEDILKGKKYTGLEVDFILHVMEMKGFEISMDIGNGEEMIPMKMPKTPPDSADDYPYADALHLRWEAPYLPDNLVHRLMIQMFPDLYKDADGNYCVWRTGARFWWKGCDALAKMNEKGLDVYVHGCCSVSADTVRAYMEIFRDKVNGIQSDLNIRATEIICHSAEGKEFKIPLSDALLQFSLRPEQDIFIRGFLEGEGMYVSPKKLLKSLYPNWEAMAEKFQTRQRHMLDLRMKEAELESIRLENTQRQLENTMKEVKATQYGKRLELEDSQGVVQIAELKAKIKKLEAEAKNTAANTKKTKTETDIQVKKIQWLIFIGLALMILLLVLSVTDPVTWRKIMDLFVRLLQAWMGKE